MSERFRCAHAKTKLKIVTFLVAILACRWGGTIVRAETADQLTLEHEMKMLKNEISLLNLLGGLYLSPAQVNRLHEYAVAANEAREPAVEQSRHRGSELRDALEALRDGAYASTGATAPIKKRATTLQKRIKDVTTKCHNVIAGIEEQARAVFTAGQLKIIGTFKPCLVPPKNLRDPVSVGQVNTGADKILALMDTLRKAPDHVYRVKEPEILLHIQNHVETEKGRMNEEMRASLRHSMSDRIRRIRRASDADYELEKRELAKELIPFDEVAIRHKGKRRTGLVAKWFLAPFSARVLAQWRSARLRDPVELSSHSAHDSNLLLTSHGSGKKASSVSTEVRQRRFLYRSVRTIVRDWRGAKRPVKSLQPALRLMNQARKRGEHQNASLRAKQVIDSAERQWISPAIVAYRKMLAQRIGRERGFRLAAPKRTMSQTKQKEIRPDAIAKSADLAAKDLFGIKEAYNRACTFEADGKLLLAHKCFIELAQTLSEFKR